MLIYKITHKLSGNAYIGKTKETLRQRFNRHCLKRSDCLRISRAIQKYGPDEFSIEMIAEYTNETDLNNAEEYYIDWYNTLSPNGYNLTTGGEGGKVSEEAKLRMSNATKGKNNPFYGKTHSQEIKQRFSTARSGSGNAMFGKKQSTETKLKISNARKGQHNSPMTEFKKGQPSTRKKMIYG